LILSIRSECPLCDDTGWKPIEDNAVRRVVRCDCWRERASAQALAQANVPPRYAACEFSNFITYPNDRLLNAVASAKRFAEAFPIVDKGLLIIGPPGIGKTHLAIAAMKQVVRTTGRGEHDTARPADPDPQHYNSLRSWPRWM
jgi:DNA replication protein DnaC